MKSKLLKSSVFLVLIAVFAAFFSLSSSAADFVKQGDFTFYSDGERAIVTAYDGKSQNVTVPTKVKSAYVIGIADQVFWSKKFIKTVTLPPTLRSIGKAAFNECTGLTKLVLPSKLTTISESAFWYCTNLEAIYIPPSVSSIADNSFRGCKKLTAYVIEGTYAEKYAKKSDDIKLGYRLISSLAVKEKTLKLEAGDKKRIKYTITPENVYNSRVSFKSDNTSVATVSSKGGITAKKCGTAVITVATTDGSKKTVKIKLTVVPQQVRNLRQTASTATGYKLEWDVSKGANGYGVYKYNTEKEKWELKSTVTKPVYKESGLKVGDSAYYRILAFAKTDKAYYKAAASDKIKASVLSPGKVSKVEATSDSDSVTLSWNRTDNTSGYIIYKLNSKGNYELIEKTPNLHIKIKALKPDTKYIFAVRAYLIYKGKEYKATEYKKNITVYTKPAPVTGFKEDSDSIGETSARLVWDKITGVSGYRLYSYDSSSQEKYKLIAKLSDSGITGYTVTLPKGKSAEFTIRTYTKKGKDTRFGPMSPVISVRSSSQPTTRDGAFNGFIDALNNAKSYESNFTLIKTTTVSDVSGDNLAECRNILDSIAVTNAEKFVFVNGTEQSASMPANYYLPPQARPSELSLANVKKFSCNFGDKGYTVHLELKEESSSSGTNSEIAPIIDWSSVAGENKGFSIGKYTYKSTVIDAEIVNGKLDSMTITMPIQFSFKYNSKSYSVSETINHTYIFIR